MLCCVVLIMLCYVVLCYIILCYVILCCVVFYVSSSVVMMCSVVSSCIFDLCMCCPVLIYLVDACSGILCSILFYLGFPYVSPIYTLGYYCISHINLCPFQLNSAWSQVKTKKNKAVSSFTGDEIAALKFFAVAMTPTEIGEITTAAYK